MLTNQSLPLVSVAVFPKKRVRGDLRAVGLIPSLFAQMVKIHIPLLRAAIARAHLILVVYPLFEYLLPIHHSDFNLSIASPANSRAICTGMSPPQAPRCVIATRAGAVIPVAVSPPPLFLRLAVGRVIRRDGRIHCLLASPKTA